MSRRKPLSFLPWLLCVLAHAAPAREQHSVKPLTDYDADNIAGKTMVVVRRVPAALKYKSPSSDGPAFAWTVPDPEHEKLLRNPGFDPAEIFEREFVSAFILQYMLAHTRAGAAPAINATSLEITGQYPDADYVLDLRTRNFVLAGSPFKNHHWVGYGIEVKLHARGMSKPVAYDYCYYDTSENQANLTNDQLANDNAVLYRRIIESLAWKCIHRVAGDLKISGELVRPIPPKLLNPLADLAE